MSVWVITINKRQRRVNLNECHGRRELSANFTAKKCVVCRIISDKFAYFFNGLISYLLELCPLTSFHFWIVAFCWCFVWIIVAPRNGPHSIGGFSFFCSRGQLFVCLPRATAAQFHRFLSLIDKGKQRSRNQLIKASGTFAIVCCT